MIKVLKNHKRIQWGIISMTLVFLVFNSCTKYDVKHNNQLNLEELDINNLNTQLDIIHLQLDSIMLDSLLKYPASGVEADALFSFYSNQETVISQKKIELKNKGSSTLFYPLKSFKVKFKKKVKNTETPIFNPETLLPNHHMDELKKISLRNSGNDFYYTMLKDVCFTHMAIELGLDLELGYFEPVQVFINHKYYGLLNMRIDKDDNSLGKLLNVDNEDITILKTDHENENEFYEIEGPNVEGMEELIAAAKDENLDFLLGKIDLNCFADYMVFEDFLGNWDWPHNNMEIYQIGTTGKYRFFLYDLDLSVNNDQFFALSKKNDKLINKMYHTLLNNKAFNELVKEKRNYLYQQATVELFNQILSQNAQKIENEIDYNISKYAVPEGKTIWYYNLQRLKEQFDLRRNNWANHYHLK